MIATLGHPAREYRIDLSRPLDISIALRGGEHNVNAWYLDAPRIEPHRQDGFVGQVSQGGSTNFNDIWFNPHSHMTHTECLGHITEAFHSVNDKLKKYFFTAELRSLTPEPMGEDLVISEKQLARALGGNRPEAVVIRTLPNGEDKRHSTHSNTNPPYLLEEAARFLVRCGVDHLLIDLPSVDRERDGGALLAHRAFWNMAGEPRTASTITELIYVPDRILDGSYILELQVAPMENDASPSRPILYEPLKP